MAQLVSSLVGYFGSVIHFHSVAFLPRLQNISTCGVQCWQPATAGAVWQFRLTQTGWHRLCLALVWAWPCGRQPGPDWLTGKVEMLLLASPSVTYCHFHFRIAAHLSSILDQNHLNLPTLNHCGLLCWSVLSIKQSRNEK